MSQTEGVIKGKLLESVKARTQFKFPRRLCIPIMTLIPLISKDCWINDMFVGAIC